MNEKIHEQVRHWLESDHLLDAHTQEVINDHLRSCIDCRNYIQMLGKLEKGAWNPYPQQRLSQADAQKVINQILPQTEKRKWLPPVDFFNFSSAVGLVGLLVMIGLFAMAISQVGETAVPAAAPIPDPGSLQYDGWEIGVAFKLPRGWVISEFDSDRIALTTPFAGIAEACAPHEAAPSVAVGLVISVEEEAPRTLIELLDSGIYLKGSLDTMGHTPATPLIEPEAVTVNGRSAAYTVAETDCNGPFNQFTAMITRTETREVLFVVPHTANDIVAAKENLETIIGSLTEVDYAGWQPWQPEGFNFSVMTPDNWNVFDALKSLQLTTSSQPMWSSYADPNPQPQPNPADMNLFHNLNSQVGDTPQAVVENLISQMAAELTMQQVEPPTAHRIIPGLVTAVYTTEDSALFFGALAYPRSTDSLHPIGAMATVPLDQLDTFGTTFERVLRSLNGSYGDIDGLTSRNTIRGGDYMPTALPSLPTATPTAYAYPGELLPTNPPPTPYP
ncbi:MAG: hypothetical protein KC445_03750 [Anaerolineales bacterium]|nr:hypothetical protein [Anaerolineales bacterium]